ncbi:MAG: hypothetical protein QOE63_1653 [Acidimicrobiaceae bacterium]
MDDGPHTSIAEQTHELRIALAMNGGVSLAVWIGGVTLEFYRASRGDEPSIYADLLRLTRSRLLIDVVAGASAGGLNGGLLAAAWSRDLPSTQFAELGDVWLETGSLSELVRDPFEKDPPSLLKGDSYFRPHLESVLRRWLVGRPVRERGPDGLQPFDAALTATTLDAQVVQNTDAVGNTWAETEYRAQFNFSGDYLVSTEANLLSRQLALAARTSASFPGAFEPSFVPIKSDDAGAPDMQPTATFGASMWAMDGGVLVNRPVGPALKLIAEHRYVEPGRRVLCYVDPAPGAAAETPTAKREDMPSLVDVILKAVVELPRNESLTDELTRIRDTSAKYDGQRHTRASLLLGQAHVGADETGTAQHKTVEVPLERMAHDLYPLWLRRTSRDAAEAAIEAHLRAIGQRPEDRVPGVPPSARGTALQWSTLIEQIGRARAAQVWLAGNVAAATTPRRPPAGWDYSSPAFDRADRWKYGLESIEYFCSTINDLFNRAIKALPFDVSGDTAAARHAAEVLESLRELRLQVRRTRADLAVIRDADAAYWRAALQALPQPQRGTVADALVAQWPWPSGSEPTSLDDLERGGIWAELSALIEPYAAPGAATPPGREAAERALWQSVWSLINALLKADGALRDAADRASDHRARKRGNLNRLLDSILGEPRARKTAAEVLHDLLVLYIVHSMIEDVDPAEAQIDFVQISSDSPSALDPARQPDQKLAGLQLGHFGAFLKSSWRANDWMWGRLDGTTQIIPIILDRDQLKRVYRNPAAAAEAMATLWTDRNEKVPDDLEALIRRHQNEDPPVADGRTLASAVARLAQAEIARVELDRIRKAIGLSGRQGARASSKAAEFADALPSAEKLDAMKVDQVADLLSSCPIGTERASSELGSSQSLIVLSSIAAVGASALGGRHSGLRFLRFLAGSLRTATLAVYLTVAGLARRERSTTALANVALALGLGIVVVRVLGGNVPVGGFPIALAALAIWSLLLSLRVRRLRAAVPMLLAVTVLVVTAIDGPTATHLFTTADGHTWKSNLRWIGTAVFCLVGVVAVVEQLRIKAQGADASTASRWRRGLGRAAVLIGAGALWWLGTTAALLDHDHKSWANALRWANEWRAVVLLVLVPLCAVAMTRLWRAVDPRDTGG